MSNVTVKKLSEILIKNKYFSTRADTGEDLCTIFYDFPYNKRDINREFPLRYSDIDSLIEFLNSLKDALKEGR